MALLEETGDEASVASFVRGMGDQELLANIGYKQELRRSFGLVSMIGFSYSILTCWTAIAGSLSETMLNGGPVALVYGWIGACVLTFFVGLSMADLCSAFPVSGGQYSWCMLLTKGTWWGRGTSYVCAWAQLAGLVCMGASPQLGYMTAAMATLNSKDESFEPSNWKVCLIFYAFLALFAVVNIFGNKILHYLSSFALYWSLACFVTCVVACLACASPHYQTADFVFTTSINDSGWNNLGMAVILGCMQAAYGMCCYDAPAHMSEELQHASRDAPRAIVMSIVIGTFTGFAFILVMLFTITDLEAVADTITGFPLLEVFHQAVGKQGALALNALVVCCEALSTNALITEGARSIYALARDGGFPVGLNEWLMYVSPTLGVPVFAILTCVGFQAGFVAILFGSSTAFYTVLDASSAGLYISYLMPIVVYMIRPNSKPAGFYNLGKWTTICHIPAVVYLTFCSVFFFFPTEMPVTGNNMNYTIVAFGIVVVLGLGSWFGGARWLYIRSVEGFEGVVEYDDAIEQSGSEGQNVDAEKVKTMAL